MKNKLHFLTTPVHKIINNLYSADNKPLAVLLSTGGFSPIHKGHLEMMEIAKEEAKINGFAVVGGYISPSHDGYIPKVYKGNRFLKIAHRLALCELAVHESNWLMVDSWEARYNKIPLLYPKVIQHLEKYLDTHLGKLPHIKVIYVFGSDNADFMKTFIHKGICICVRRKGYEVHLKNILSKYHITQNQNIIISSKKIQDYSSGNVRLGKNPNINKEVNYLWKLWKKTSDRDTPSSSLNKVYLFRNDIRWAISSWITKDNCQKFKSAMKEFSKGVVNAFDETFKQPLFPDLPQPCKFHLIDTRKQIKIVSELNRNNQLLNLDLITNSKNKLHFSRLYGISDGQCHVKVLIPRPGYDGIKNQQKKIPDGKYVFLDDDIASGETRDMLLKKLPERITVEKSISLLDIFLRQNHIQKDNMLDICDLRDFMAGTREAGLVVKLPDNKIGRAPYILPYVSLVSRAKVPPSREYRLSLILWKLNAEFHNSLKHAILLRDADQSFRILMKYIGFIENTPMSEICQWHLDKLISASDHPLS